MRVKQLWNYVPLPQSLRLVWDRLTFSQLTTLYFVVALIHCFIQVIFQISALLINQDAIHVLAHITAVDPNTPTGYAVLAQNGPLRACTGMPGSTGSTACQMVWAGRVAPDAFGDDEDYYNEPDDYVASTTTSIASLVSPSVQSSTLRTSTVRVTVGASSAASSPAIQTPVATSRSVPVSTAATSTSSTSRALASSTTSVAIAPVSAVPVSASSTSPVPPGGSPVVPAGPVRAKRMYIPAHVPGSKTHSFSKRDLSITPVFSQFNGTFQGVRLNGLSAANYGGSSLASTDETEAFISSVCVHALQWPLQRLGNTQREDAVFIGFQFWVLGMSVVALLNESVPHIIAAFLTHLLATGWSVFQLLHTANFRSEFNRLTTRGACGGVNLLPAYWKARTNAEIPILVLNVVVLVGSGYMSWKLLKTFGWLTFKRVGASLEINRIYKVVLSLSIVLQLSLFFLIVSMALWIEELYHGPAAAQTKLAPLYKTIVTIQLVALVPWLVMGWYAVRREMRKTMIAFIALSALFVVSWAGMFVSPTWRLTFLTWMFFRIMSINAVVLTVLSLGLGVVCFLNFGKDLPKHLRLMEDPEGGDFVPAQPPYDEKSEKVEFPAQNAFPTFSAAFPSRPTSMASSGTHSRTNSTESRAESVAPPQVVARLPAYRNFQVERPMSAESVDASVRDPFEHDLERVMSGDTYPTMRSISSTQSVGAAPGLVPAAGMGKRWFIE